MPPSSNRGSRALAQTSRRVPESGVRVEAVLGVVMKSSRRRSRPGSVASVAGVGGLLRHPEPAHQSLFHVLGDVALEHVGAGVVVLELENSPLGDAQGFDVGVLAGGELSAGGVEMIQVA